jgi:hypothetical protein
MIRTCLSGLLIASILAGCSGSERSPTEPLTPTNPGLPSDVILADDGVATVTDDFPRGVAHGEWVHFTVSAVGREGIGQFQQSSLTFGFAEPFVSDIGISFAGGSIQQLGTGEYSGGAVVLKAEPFTSGTRMTMVLFVRVKQDHPLGQYPLEIKLTASNPAIPGEEKTYAKRFWTQLHEGDPPPPTVPADIIFLDDGIADLTDDFPRRLQRGQVVTFTVAAVGREGIGQYKESAITFGFGGGFVSHDSLELISYEGLGVSHTVPPAPFWAWSAILKGGPFSPGKRIAMTLRVGVKADYQPGVYQMAVNFVAFNTGDADARRFAKRFWILLE